MAKAHAPVAKFREYIFKPGATHGKDAVFTSLGFHQEHSEELASLYEKQATGKYAKGEFILGKVNEYGRRIDIEIELTFFVLTESGEIINKASHLRTGWMIQPNGDIHLNTPFSGFTRKQR